jgi:predicted dienelactone hydrolase
MPDLPPRPFAEPPSGPQTVATSDVEAFDAHRGRSLPLRLHVPQGSRAAPLVIVSHGTGGDRAGYGYLGRALASHGFLAVHPTHLGSDASLLTSQRYSLNRSAILRASQDPGNWRARALDVRFLLSRLAWIEEAAHLAIDRERIAVVGHSLGALTAMALAGALVQLPDGPASYREPLVRAVVALSPYGEGSAFDAASWASVAAPVLWITGTQDKGLQGEPPAWRTAPFERLPTGGKWLVSIEGATHLAFTDPMPFNDVPAVRAAARRLTLAFFANYLFKNDLGAGAGFREALKETAGIQWTER